jgi:putative SOS response-associated peptidase YedK
MSEDEENKEIDEKKKEIAAKVIDDAMFKALKDLCMEKYKEMISDRLENLEKQNKFFKIVTKDGNVIIANHFVHPSRYDEELNVFMGGQPVARIKFETIVDVDEF